MTQKYRKLLKELHDRQMRVRMDIYSLKNSIRSVKEFSEELRKAQKEKRLKKRGKIPRAL